MPFRRINDLLLKLKKKSSYYVQTFQWSEINKAFSVDFPYCLAQGKEGNNFSIKRKKHILNRKKKKKKNKEAFVLPSSSSPSEPTNRSESVIQYFD